MAEPQEDKAWVTVTTGLEARALHHFCSDLERLLRINPLLEIEQWRSTGGSEYRAEGKNLSNDQPLALAFRVEPCDDGLRLSYTGGIKQETRLQVETTETGSNLIITDHYRRTENEEQLAEVDRSLIPWGHAIHRYLKSWQRWSWCPPWRWYMRRIWQPMTPSSRRIAHMVVVVTGLEFIAFLMVFTIFWLELDQLLAL